MLSEQLSTVIQGLTFAFNKILGKFNQEMDDLTQILQGKAKVKAKVKAKMIESASCVVKRGTSKRSVRIDGMCRRRSLAVGGIHCRSTPTRAREKAKARAH